MTLNDVTGLVGAVAGVVGAVCAFLQLRGERRRPDGEGWRAAVPRTVSSAPETADMTWSARPPARSVAEPFVLPLPSAWRVTGARALAAAASGGAGMAVGVVGVVLDDRWWLTAAAMTVAVTATVYASIQGIRTWRVHAVPLRLACRHEADRHQVDDLEGRAFEALMSLWIMSGGAALALAALPYPHSLSRVVLFVVSVLLVSGIIPVAWETRA